MRSPTATPTATPTTPRGPMASLRDQKKADTRHRLAMAAAELLVTEGVEAATVSAIAERAGVSPRTFHNYFAHREDAFLMFIEEQVGEWAVQIDEAPSDTSPLTVLRGIFGDYYRLPKDSLTAPTNLVLVGEQTKLLLSNENRRDAAELLAPLYESVRGRVPDLTGVEVRVLVDMSLAAGVSVLQHTGRGADADPGERVEVLEEAFALLERGLGAGG